MKILLTCIFALFLSACDASAPEGKPVSDSGVAKASARVRVGSDGLTIEQRNVKRRVEEDNKPGTIKYLYIISSMTGDVILQSIVDGKITSGGKRLTAGTQAPYGTWRETHNGWYSPEAIQDDGTYGSSSEYLYWWDTAGNYYQYFITGGVVPIISSRPLRFGKLIQQLANETETTSNK
jgi:hypothetical protein